jgi:hypothetical protein
MNEKLLLTLLINFGFLMLGYAIGYAKGHWNMFKSMADKAIHDRTRFDREIDELRKSFMELENAKRDKNS